MRLSTDLDRARACVPDHGLYRTDGGGQTRALLGPRFEWANAVHVPAWNSNLLVVADVLVLNVLGSFTGGNQSFDVSRGLASDVRCLSSSPFQTYAGTSGDGVVRLRQPPVARAIALQTTAPHHGLPALRSRGPSASLSPPCEA